MKLKIFNVVVCLLLIASIPLMLYYKIKLGEGKPASTRLELVEECNTDCVIDDEGWIGDPNKLGKQLKNAFFVDTGIQPFIYINKFMPYIESIEEKQEFAEQWYKKNIPDEYTFLFMYFPQQDPNAKGYIACVVGAEARGIITEEFISKFNDLIDDYWLKVTDTDAMIVQVYKEMANWAMSDITSSSAVIGKIKRVLVCLVICAGILNAYVKIKLLYNSRQLS